MRDVVILGVGMTPFGRHLDKSHEQLTQAAVRLALADAGVPPDQIQMAVYANVIQGFFAGEMSIPGEYALRPLGISGVRGFHVEAACASSTAISMTTRSGSHSSGLRRRTTRLQPANRNRSRRT